MNPYDFTPAGLERRTLPLSSWSDYRLALYFDRPFGRHPQHACVQPTAGRMLLGWVIGAPNGQGAPERLASSPPRTSVRCTPTDVW